jgi:hypothetical protein
MNKHRIGQIAAWAGYFACITILVLIAITAYSLLAG